MQPLCYNLFDAPSIRTLISSYRFIALSQHARRRVHGRVDAARKRDDKNRHNSNKKEQASEFQQQLRDQALLLQKRLETSEFVHHQEQQGHAFKHHWADFKSKLVHDRAGNTDTALIKKLKELYRVSGPNALLSELEYTFFDTTVSSQFTQDEISRQKAIADLRYPVEWYPLARASPRQVHLHVGPTNSGKTYHALKRLEAAESGVYAGPLRLLAHEVYSRLNAQGKPCMLLTGEERRQSAVGEAYTPMISCTVEMVPLTRQVEVAVLDEIQMIGNSERGWAWTQALLGLRANEIHLCGETRTVPLIRQICASTGDELHVHTYERLSPLAISPKSLDGDLSQLRKGDCIVCFSVVNIHAMRKQVERATGKSVAIVYGSLPPETRANQARLFNDPDNDYDFLVASDAIGMGLNLSIKRIIFETSSKFDGKTTRTLETPDIKQIAGRAGRYKVAAYQGVEKVALAAQSDLVAPNGDKRSTHLSIMKEDSSTQGLVTTLEKFDFPIIKAAMATDPAPIQSAGLFPTTHAIHKFSQHFPPGTPLSFILRQFTNFTLTHHRYHMCDLISICWVADLIQPIRNLTISERLLLSSCPASKSDMELLAVLLPSMARCVAEQSGGSFVDLLGLPLEILQEDVQPSRTRLRQLELLHKSIVLYLWLSYRFAGIFPDRRLAFHVKTIVEDHITQVLDGLDTTPSAIAHRRATRKAVADSALGSTSPLDDPDEETAGLVDAPEDHEEHS